MDEIKDLKVFRYRITEDGIEKKAVTVQGIDSVIFAEGCSRLLDAFYVPEDRIPVLWSERNFSGRQVKLVMRAKTAEYFRKKKRELKETGREYIEKEKENKPDIRLPFEEDAPDKYMIPAAGRYILHLERQLLKWYEETKIRILK